jgi:hypothetical protein
VQPPIFVVIGMCAGWWWKCRSPKVVGRGWSWLELRSDEVLYIYKHRCWIYEQLKHTSSSCGKIADEYIATSHASRNRPSCKRRYPDSGPSVNCTGLLSLPRSPTVLMGLSDLDLCPDEADVRDEDVLDCF